MRTQASQDIRDEIRSIVTDITRAQAESDHELVSELTDELIDLIDTHEDKYELYASTIRNSINGAEKRREIARPYMKEASALNKLAKQLKERLQDDMKQHNLREVEAGKFTIRILRANIPKVIVNIPVERLPERFQRVEPRRQELQSAIIDGEEVEGVTLELSEFIQIFPFE